MNAESSSTLETIEQLREAEGREAYGPYSAYRSVEAILFLEKRAAKARSPTFNPNYKDRVYSTSEEDCSVPNLSGELELGRLRSGEQLLDGKGIKPQKGLKDHALFHSKVRYYSAKDKKMAVGLHTITPEKLGTLFADTQPPQRRLAWALYRKLGKQWIEFAWNLQN